MVCVNAFNGINFELPDVTAAKLLRTHIRADRDHCVSWVMARTTLVTFFVSRLGELTIFHCCQTSFRMCKIFSRHSDWLKWNIPAKGNIQHVLQARGVQPFAIAGRITFVYMKYGQQW